MRFCSTMLDVSTILTTTLSYSEFGRNFKRNSHTALILYCNIQLRLSFKVVWCLGLAGRGRRSDLLMMGCGGCGCRSRRRS